MDKRSMERVNWVIENYHLWYHWSPTILSLTDYEMAMSMDRKKIYDGLVDAGLYSKKTNYVDAGIMRIVRMAYKKKNLGIFEKLG